MARWRKENATEGALYNREWSLTEAGKEYRKRHAEYAREWRKKNRERFKANQKRAYDNARMKVLTHYSSGTPHCKCCGETEILFLHLDHKNGDGADHRRKLMAENGYYPGGNGLPYWLMKNNFPEGFQVLCANCNLAKRQNKTCPHQYNGKTEVPISSDLP